MLGVGGRSALEERASQALELERRGLAQALKYKYAGGQRERLLQVRVRVWTWWRRGWRGSRETGRLAGCKVICSRVVLKAWV